MQLFLRIKAALVQSLWFLPFIALGIISLLFCATIVLDSHAVVNQIAPFKFFYQMDIDASRALVGKLAAAIMTMAGIVFSLVFVALSLASGQLGPRLLQHFISDKVTQIALGLFVSAFVFQCLTFLALGDDLPFDTVPGITLACALLIALASLLFLVYFIHHLASGLQADVVVDNIFKDFKSKLMRVNRPATQIIEQHKAHFQQVRRNSEQMSVTAKTSGYFQAIDKPRLLSICQQTGCYLEFRCCPGDYIVAGQEIVDVYFESRVDAGITDKITPLIMMGGIRTPLQDLEFEIHQLTEIAIRSLSPGINDPHTAHTCIDKLSEVAILAATEGLPSPFSTDAVDVPRLTLPTLSLATVFHHMFNPIIRHGQQDFSVTLCFMEAFRRMAGALQTADARAALQPQIDLFLGLQHQQLKHAPDEQLWSDFRMKITELQS